MPTHYILINEAGVYVKDAAFFICQGGLVEPWGRLWEPVETTSLYAAREIGIKRRRERYPDCHKTKGEDGEPAELYWPEARGV